MTTENALSTMQLIMREIARVLAPLTSAATSDEPAVAIRDLFFDAGVDVSDEAAAMATVSAAAQTASDVIAQWAGEAATAPPDWKTSLNTVRALIDALTDVNVARVGAPLFEFLVIEYLATYRHAVFSWLRFLGVIQTETGISSRLGLHLDALPSMVSSPASHLAAVYKWPNAFEAGALVANIEPLFNYLGISTSLDFANDGSRDLLGVDAHNENPNPLLRIPIVTGSGDAAFVAIGATFVADPEPWVAFVPFGTMEVSDSLEVAEGWEARLEVSGDATTPHAVMLRPSGLEIVADSGDAALNCVLKGYVARNTHSPQVVLGTDDGSSLSVSGIGLRVEASYGSRNEASISIPVQELKLRIVAGAGDGFLKKLLPPNGINAHSDFEIGWHSSNGLFFRGSAHLETTLPLHVALGPILVESLYVIVSGRDSKLQLGLGLSVSGQIGPVAVAVERIGVTTSLTVKEGGNLGPLDIGEPGFLPPTGGGLAIAAGPVTGGGFFDVESEHHRYSGILQLQFGEIGLVATVIITTKLPGGRDGYALFVNIGVTFSPPITLPYNFNLSGCGGLLAINRTMDVEALRAGLRNKTLDSILFPEDPILNATKIINDSERVFPIQPDRFVVAPMAKGGWGPNSIVKFSLAIALEIPEPIVVAILGQIKAKFPNPENDRVKLNLDVLGVIEFAKKSLSIDATLYDSKIVTYDLSGDSALRLKWGSKPVFAMSLGGFHPKFSPPPKFPNLRGLKLQLSSSDALELSCTVYQALTSNTLQFGARVDVHAEAAGAELDGDVSFDTLIYFSPFSFSADISGGVSATYKGHDIASVRLSFDLSGPNPWHAKGKAKVSVLRWDVTAKFNKTWGNDDAVRLPSVDPWTQFQAEVALASNWGAGLLPKRTAVEALSPLKALSPPRAATEESDGATSAPPVEEIVAHPAFGLEVSQRLLPLNMRLEKFGNADIHGHHTFDLHLEIGSEGSSNADALEESERRDHFAMGPFKKTGADDLLTQPSYEEKKAGVIVRPLHPRLHGEMQPCDLEYESIFIGSDGVARERCIAPAPKWSNFAKTTAMNAAALARFAGMAKYTLPGSSPQVSIRDEGYKIVNADTLRASDLMSGSSGALTYTEATAIAAGNSGVIVVPESEEEVA